MPIVVTKDDNDVPEILAQIQILKNAKIAIGIFGEDSQKYVMIATVHEYGVEIDVTPQMRGWFMYQGWPLSPDTTTIKIPERSYLRKAFDENKQKMIKRTGSGIEAVLEGRMRATTLLNTIGEWLRSIARTTITKVSEPPLHPMTVEGRRKGSGSGSPNPLVDEGMLRQRITYKIITD